MSRQDEAFCANERAPWANDRSAQDTQTSLPPDCLRVPVKALQGVALKEAEILTRHLLPTFAPSHSLLPPPPPTHAPLHDFITGAGFSSLHPALDPGARGQLDESGKLSYGVPGPRASRKRQQIVNMVHAIASHKRISSTLHFVDFCAGCGHVGLVIAALFPAWRVTILDSKPNALAIARARANDAGLSNVRIFEGDLHAFDEPFDIGTALHACGAASDGVLTLCVRRGAAAVVAPCCVGAVVSAKADTGITGFGEARSRRFRGAVGHDDFARLARAADFGEAAKGGDLWRVGAKALVEADRCEALKDKGFQAVLVKMRPLECTPKNDIIVAAPADKFPGDWEVDAVADDVVNSLMKGGATSAYPDNLVKDIEKRIIRAVVAEGSHGELSFPCKRGARERKLVHAVAIELGLFHSSCGGGAKRRVRVARDSHWPLYWKGIVGLGGKQVQRVGNEIAMLAPAPAREERENARGKAFHVTVLSAADVKGLVGYGGKGKKEREKLLALVGGMVRGSNMMVKGMGRRELGGCVAYYAVLKWEAAQICREKLGLDRKDFHITVGFVGGDVHKVRKDESTVVETMEIECAPWAD